MRATCASNPPIDSRPRLKKLVLTTTTVRALDAAPLASVAGARKVTLISLMPTGPLC